MPSVPALSEARSFMPASQTIGRFAKESSTKGDAEARVTVTVLPVALAVAPAGTNTPRNGLLFFGSST